MKNFSESTAGIFVWNAFDVWSREEEKREESGLAHLKLLIKNTFTFI